MLHVFNGKPDDNPLAGLVRDQQGVLYGTASDYAGPGYGAVFSVTP
jgi:hypothetical protein